MPVNSATHLNARWFAVLFGAGCLLLTVGCTGSEYDASQWDSIGSESFPASFTSLVSKGDHNDAQKAVGHKEPIRPLSPPSGLSPQKVELGHALFNDVRLSGDNTISCASCHSVKDGGADGLPTSIGIGGQVGSLNAPSVLNSSLSIAQFWDGRAKTLAEQVSGPIHNPLEMGSNWEEILSKLNEDRTLVSHFQDLYPQGMTAETITDAIVSYERALITLNSPFDQYLQGDPNSITPDALAGYQHFKSLGCVSCHQGQGVGGNMFQEFGVMGDCFEDWESTCDADKGRINVTHRSIDLHRFKVPSLRNVEWTAPYFHHGRTETLEEAIKVMAEYQLGETLSEQQVKEIKAFLISLTGEIEEQLQ